MGLQRYRRREKVERVRQGTRRRVDRVKIGKAENAVPTVSIRKLG